MAVVVVWVAVVAGRNCDRNQWSSGPARQTGAGRKRALRSGWCEKKLADHCTTNRALESTSLQWNYNVIIQFVEGQSLWHCICVYVYIKWSARHKQQMSWTAQRKVTAYFLGHSLNQFQANERICMGNKFSERVPTKQSHCIALHCIDHSLRLLHLKIWAIHFARGEHSSRERDTTKCLRLHKMAV